jgi:hypothetical protein
MNQRRRWALLLLPVAGLIGTAAYIGHQRWLDGQFVATPVAAQASDPLAKRVSIDVRDAPLRDVLSDLAEANGLELIVDLPALEAAGLTGDETITVKLDGVPLRALLSRLPAHAARELKVLVDEKAMYLTPWSSSTREVLKLETRVYPLTKLLDSPFEFDHRIVGELVESTIAPAEWEDVGGVGVIEAVPGALVVSQTPDVHRQVELLLARLDALDHAGFAAISLDEPDEDSEIIEEHLSQQVTIDLWEASLTEIVRWISAECEVPMLIDHLALADYGIFAEEWKITIQLREITLRSALRIILNSNELTYVVKDGILEITTPQEAETQLVTKLHPIQDLSVWLDDDLDSLIDVMTAIVAVDTWDFVGGPGAMESYGGCLVVLQMPEVHLQLEKTLWRIRRHAFPHLADSFPASTETPTPAERRIEKALQEPITIDTTNESLNHLARRLSDEVGINIRLDTRALEDFGIAPETSISMEQVDVPLREALRAELAEEELSVLIKDEVLWITTPWQSEAALLNRVYPIGDLIRTAQGLREPESLLQTLMALIEPDSWDDWGGAGSMRELGDILVVSAELSMQERVVELLTGLRDWARAGKPADFAFSTGQGEETIRAYDVRLLTDALLPRWSGRERQYTPWYMSPIETQRGFSLQFSRRGLAGLQLAMIDALTLLAGSPADTSVFARASAYQGRLLVACSPSEHEDVARNVDLLMRAAERGPEELAVISTGREATPIALSARLYLVHALTQETAGWDRFLLEQMVREIVTPLSWDQLALPDPPRMETLPGFLVIRHDEAGHASVSRLLKHVMKLDEHPFQELPPLEDEPFLSDRVAFAIERPAVERLLAEIASEDQVERDFAVWMLGHLREPDAKVVEVLTQRLTIAVAESDEQLQDVLLPVIMNCDDALAAAVPTLETMLRTPAWEQNPLRRALAINAFCLCGEQAVPALRRLLSDKSALGVEELKVILDTLKSDAQPVVPELLGWIRDGEFGQIEATFYEVDPHGVRSREVVARWQRSDNPALREQAKRVTELLFLGVE